MKLKIFDIQLILKSVSTKIPSPKGFLSIAPKHFKGSVEEIKQNGELIAKLPKLLFGIIHPKKVKKKTNEDM